MSDDFRGANCKLVPQHCKYDLRKYYFTNRVVPMWNSLPNELVMVDNLNLFKQRLDKLWLFYDFVYLQGGPKKVNPKCSTHNFVKYWPILKILSLL